MIMWYNVTIISNMRVEQMKIKTVEMRYEDVLTLPAAVHEKPIRQSIFFACYKVISISNRNITITILHNWIYRVTI